MKAGIIRGISILILGVILGAVITNLHIGSQLDRLALDNRKMKDELTETRRMMRKLKEASETRKKHVISEVDTFMLIDSWEGLTDYDKLTAEYEANKKIKDWLKPIIGQDVAGLDILLIPGIVDNREIEANGNRYRLRTYLVVVNEKTTVYIKSTRVKTGEKIN